VFPKITVTFELTLESGVILHMVM